MSDDLPPELASAEPTPAASGGDVPPVEIRRVLPWYMRPWWQLALLVLLILVASPFAYRSSRLAGVPDIGEPFDMAAFVAVKVDPADNAAVDYEAASKLLVPLPAGLDRDFEKALKGDWGDASAGVRKWVADNAAALARWRAGTDKPDCLVVDPKVIDVASLLTAIQECRQLAKLAHLRCKELEAAGDVESAWMQCRAIYRCSRHMGRHGCLIQQLIGVSIHTMAHQAIGEWAQHPAVSADMIDKAQRQLDRDWGLTAPPSEGLKIEYLSMSHTLDWKISDLADFASSASRSATVDKALALFVWINNEREFFTPCARLSL